MDKELVPDFLLTWLRSDVLTNELVLSDVLPRKAPTQPVIDSKSTPLSFRAFVANGDWAAAVDEACVEKFLLKIQ